MHWLAALHRSGICSPQLDSVAITPIQYETMSLRLCCWAFFVFVFGFCFGSGFVYGLCMDFFVDQWRERCDKINHEINHTDFMRYSHGNSHTNSYVIAVLLVGVLVVSDVSSYTLLHHRFHSAYLWCISIVLVTHVLVRLPLPLSVLSPNGHAVTQTSLT